MMLKYELDLGILKMYLDTKFLGQGFRKLEHAYGTDRHTDKQM